MRVESPARRVIACAAALISVVAFITSAPGSASGATTSCAGANNQPVAVGVSASGAQELFVVDGSGRLRTSWQTSPGGTWTAWTDLVSTPVATITSPVGVGHGPDGALEIYFINTQQELATMWQKGPNGSWTAPVVMTGSLEWSYNQQIGVGIAANGEQEIYMVDGVGVLWTKWQTSPGGSWSPMQSLNGAWQPGSSTGLLLNAPVSVGNGPGGVQEIYTTSTSGALMTMWQVRPNGSWSKLQQLDGIGGLTAPSCGMTWPTPVGIGQVGNVQELYFIDNSGNLMTAWQKSAGGTWTDLVNLNGLTGLPPQQQVAVGRQPNGAQQLYFVDPEDGSTSPGSLQTMLQDSPGGRWGGMQDLGSGWSDLT